MNLAVGGTLDTINENNNVTIRGNEKNEQNLKLSKIAQISSFVFTTCCYINPMYTGNPLTGTLANSKDPDRNCLLRLKQPWGTEIHHNLEIQPNILAFKVRGGNSPRFSIRKIVQLNHELGQKCSEITNKMFKRTKHP